jgi:hypothetical protein
VDSLSPHPKKLKKYVYKWRCITMEIVFVMFIKSTLLSPSEIIDAYKCAVSWQITSERDKFRLNLLIFCIL